MQCTTHGAIKASALHKEAVAIRASAPSKAHIRAYMTVVDGKPARTQTPPLEGEGEPHLPTENPHPGRETLHSLQVDLGVLADQELHQLMEDLCQEVTICELNAPPAALHQCLGETQQETGTLMQMTRRSPFQEGRVGSPRTIILTFCCHTDR